MKTTWRVLVVLISVFLMITGFAVGQVPQLINYQGVLVDLATGQPVPDDTYSITFSIYDVASGGSHFWTETQSLTTKNGLYSVLLGSSTPLTPTILSGPEKYLGIKVGSDPEMTLRRRIVSAAYAITSSEVSGTSNVFPSDGNVGIGTVSPGAKLVVNDYSGACYLLITGVGNEWDYSGLILEDPTNYKSWGLYHKLGEFRNYFVIQEFDGSDWLGRLTIIPGGNVGIGEWITPEQLLHLKSGDDPTLKIQSDGTDEISGRLSLRQSDNTGFDIYYDGRTDFEGLAFRNFDQGTPDSVCMFINQDGNVGIGTTSPLFKLHVEKGAIAMKDANGSVRIYASSGSEYGGKIDFHSTAENFRGTIRANTPLSGEQLNGLAYISVYDHFFMDGTNNILVTIKNGGNVGIGMKDPTNILTIKQNSDTDPIADAWTTYSSKRWKTNIKLIDGALDKVNRLRGVSYDWKADGKHDIGLIAEEVGEVIPEVVAYEENGIDAKSIDYARLVAVLIEANKELQKEIEQQKEQQKLNNKKQQTTIDDLSARILNIEKTIRNSDTKLSNITNESQ